MPGPAGPRVLCRVSADRTCRACRTRPQRVDELQRDQLAHPPKAARPWTFLRNSWVLLIAVGVLVVIILAEARIPSAKALANIHAASPSAPYVKQLPGSSV